MSSTVGNVQEINVLISETIEDLILILNKDYMCQYVNETVLENIIELDRTDILGINLFKLVFQEDIEILSDLFKEIDHTGRSIKEIRINSRSNQPKYFEILGKSFKDSASNQGYILISKEISALKASEEQYRFITDNINDILSFYDKHMNLKYINEAGEKISGFTFEELKGRRSTEFMHPEDVSKIARIFKDAIKNGTGTGELRMKAKDGTYIWMEASAKVTVDKNKDPITIIVSRDITKRKELEHELKETEKRYQYRINNITDGLFELGVDGTIKYFSPQVKELFGYSPQEVIGLNALDYVHPEDLSGFKEKIKNAMQSKDVFSHEYRTLKKDGDYINVSTRASFIKAEGEEKIIGVVRDITERYVLQQQIEQSERKYKHLFENSPFSIWLMDFKGRVVDFNTTTKYFFLDINPADLKGKSLPEIAKIVEHYKKLHGFKKDLLPSEFFEKFKTHYQVLLKGDNPEPLEFKVIRTNGEDLWLHFQSSIIHLNTEKLIQIIVQDITEKKNAEIKLRESEEKFRHLFQSTPFGIWIVNMKGVVIDCNDGFNKFLSIYTKEDIIGKNYRDVLGIFERPEHFQPMFADRLKMLLKNGYLEPIEFQMARADGVKLCITLESTLFKIGRDSFIQVIIKDITERKEAELLLAESEQQYRYLFEKSPFSIVLMDKQGKIIDINDKFEKIYGYSKNEIIADSPFIFTKIFSRSEDFKLLLNTVFKGKDVDQKELKVIRKDGKSIWIEVEANHIEYGNKHYLQFLSEDISLRKEAEIKLKQSEEALILLNKELEHKIQDRTTELRESRQKFKNMIDYLDIGYFHVSMEGELLYHNPSFNKLFKTSLSDDLSGMDSLTLWQNPEEREHYLDLVLRDKVLRNYEIQGFNKKGEKIIVEINCHLVEDDDGLPKGIEGTVSEITERVKLEQQFKESEEKFRTITEQSLMGIIIVQESKIIYVNQRLSEMLLYSLEEMKKWSEKDFSKLMHPNDRDLVLDQLRKKQAGMDEIILQYKFRARRKDNNFIWVENFSRSINYGGKPADLAIIIDINDRVILEGQLRESEEKFRTITEQALMGICILQDSKIKYVNQKASEIIQYSIEELLNMSEVVFSNLIYPKDKERVIGEYKKKQKGSKDIIPSYQIRLLRKDGKLIWVENFSKTINYLGKPADMVIIIDITERMSLQNQLKESEEKFRSIAEQNLLGIGIIKDGFLIYGNKALEDITEGTFEEMQMEKRNFFIKAIHPDDIPHLWKKIQERQKSGSTDPYQYSLRIITKSGKIKWVENFIKPIVFEGKIADLSVIVDITNQKETEMLLRESERKLWDQYIELKEIDRLKNDFITITAHELKTPLMSITGYTELILEQFKNLDPELKDDLIRVQKNAQRLKLYIDQILDVMKIEADKMDLERKSRHIRKIIENCIAELGAQLKKKDLKVEINVDENIILEIDKTRIIQVFSNLLSNAIKYSPNNGMIAINAHQKENETIFQIKDNGMGLTEDEISKVFDKFVNLKRDEPQKGTGLGLYICKGIIEGHDGNIWVESDGRDKGASFYFSIPS